MESPSKRLKEEFLPFDSLPPLFRQAYFRQVLSHIDSSRQWYRFALVCKEFADLCRNEAEQRKMEFARSIPQWLCHVKSIQKFSANYMTLPSADTKIVHPNGKFHGTWTTRYNLLRTCHYGRLQGSELETFYFFIQNVLVVSCPGKYVMFHNVSIPHYVIGNFCPACGKVHYFNVNRGRLRYLKGCSENAYRIEDGSKRKQTHFAFHRRMVIAKSILEYAQTQIN